MKLFCIALSLILVMAKIFGLITLGWFACLLPVILYVLVYISLVAIATCALLIEDMEDKKTKN